jgi:tRNA/tmRNA/rRNA uracil-C5-methylase (TrmA/RlmC/RlmD family)
MASYSSKGPTMRDRFVKPDLVAPGNKVISDNDPYIRANNNAFYQLSAKANVPFYQLMLSGTSMAAPMSFGGSGFVACRLSWYLAGYRKGEADEIGGEIVFPE